MANWRWSPRKDELLRKSGRPTFNEVLDAIEEGRLHAIEENPRHPGQKRLIVTLRGYTHCVPFREDGENRFMITIYPSRVLHKRFGGL